MANYIFYPPTTLRNHGKYNELDATEYYLKHSSILLALKQLLRQRPDFDTKATILNEMDIAERKINYWSKRANFDTVRAANATMELKKVA